MKDWLSGLLAYFKFSIHQYTQVLLFMVVLNPFILQFLQMFRISLMQMQHLTLSLVELHKVHMGLLLKTIKIPLDGIPFSNMSAWWCLQT